MSFFVRARFAVPEDRREEFETIAFALREEAAQEPGTLTYRWFSPGPGSYLVLEQYMDAEAALAHNERAAELLARVGDCATMVSAELYGPLTPDLEEWVRAHPQATVFAELPDPR
ncbi:MAG TPA: antibiotic biosynthesis monooxygenase family protein [Actinocrinis sp.]|nr:antibiotic biosynthesis monooxygenase family protein [Actinocrinis sp.]